MRFAGLATDYDGTLAQDGVVNEPTRAALKRSRESGRKLLLVTGRRLDDLLATFDGVAGFDLVVAENGALVYEPRTGAEHQIGAAPPAEFGAALERKGVWPLDRGRVIIATLANQRQTVIDTIAAFGLELQVIFNKGALMILPAGVTKATGLEAALAKLGLSRHNIAGIGDAENDHAFLSACECAVAVANALPSLKEHADLVTTADHGNGVIELIDHLIREDLASLSDRLARHNVLLGSQEDGTEITIPVYGENLLLAGPSGAGKSTLMTGVMERLTDAEYQLCVFDPEGDYQRFPDSLVLGDSKSEPSPDQVLQALTTPRQTVVVNLLGVPLANRADYFARLLPRLAEMQADLGRPHWIVADEIHHLASAEGRSSPLPDVTGFLAATLDPACVAPALAKKMTGILVVGDAPDRTISAFAGAIGAKEPPVPVAALEKGNAVLWRPDHPEKPLRFRIAQCKTARTRHSRKYAEAVLAPDRSFYFRGSEGKLNLRASNLITFVQMMDGVDDETYAYHLGRHDYSTWFRDNIKNPELAEETERIENSSLPAAESKVGIKQLIEDRYTLPG